VDRHLAKPPKRIVLDIDATDDPTHGRRSSTSSVSYTTATATCRYSCSVRATDRRWRSLRRCYAPGSAHPGKDAPALIRRLVERIQAVLPMTKILVRADAGFASPEFYDTCEDLKVKYLVCIGTNSVLERESASLMVQARALRDETGAASRLFGAFSYAAGTWKKPRRVIVKAEALPAKEKARNPKVKDNARYVVTNLDGEPQALYGEYCLRGECENRIKEMKLDLVSGRTSCHRFTANAFRLMLNAVAFALMGLVRDLLAGHELARSTVGQIRLKLLKVGVIVQEVHPPNSRATASGPSARPIPDETTLKLRSWHTIPDNRPAALPGPSTRRV